MEFGGLELRLYLLLSNFFLLDIGLKGGSLLFLEGELLAEGLHALFKAAQLL